MKLDEFVKDNYSMLLRIFNAIKVGIWVTDGEGRVVLINDESARTGGLRREELLGKKMTELLTMGYILYESSVLKALETHSESSLVQELGEGGKLFVTSVPLFEGNKENLIVCTERDITETLNLKELLRQQEKLAEKYQSELTHLRKHEVAKEGQIIVFSAIMRNLLKRAVRIAAKDTTVMLTGESGTGKEMIANLIYENSTRFGKPFIKVNCAAIPETLLESEFFGYEKGSFTGARADGKIGYFEMANHGILFLDEIADLPIQMQSKLLRALQEKEIRKIGGTESISVDVRIISATNKNLKEEIEKGTFREDLYYRLNIVPIHLPPLRERKSEICELAEHFVQHFNQLYDCNKTLAGDAIKPLLDYNWPGNIRELRNIMERLVVSGQGPIITYFQVYQQLDEYIKESTDIYDTSLEKSLNEIMEQFEKDIILRYLEKEGNISKAAHALRVNKSTISRKVKKYKYKK